MDAHLFRRFCDALLPTLPGTRLEKIYQPGQGVTVFGLYGTSFLSSSCSSEQAAKKRHLVLRAERKSPLLFVSGHKLTVNAHPPAQIMRLRKHLHDHRIRSASAHWTERRLYLEIEGDNGPIWLLLDLREGPRLLFDAPPSFEEPRWPDASTSLRDLCEGEEWREWPVITPALRRTLPLLEDEEAAALLADLQCGGGDVFMYENGSGPLEISAWPLPPARLAKLGGAWTESVWDDPLAALALAGERDVYGRVGEKARQEAARPHEAEVRRLSRLLKKLEREEARLNGMRDRQKDALLLQSQLYRFRPEEKAPFVVLETEQGPRELKLDPRLTVRENMSELFRQAARGKRGLEHLDRRRVVILAEKNAAADAMLRSAASLSGAGPAAPAHHGGGTAGSAPGVLTGKAARIARREAEASGRPSRFSAQLPSQIQAFRSSDGFLLLRGRDTRGNALALKLAAPHDYWLHTAEGPSAHVIIRRDHAGQEIPERTLREAGALAALKSPLKDGAWAEIQYSLARYIHPMKGAAPGMVRIDRSEGAFRAAIDPTLEQKLKLG